MDHSLTGDSIPVPQKRSGSKSSRKPVMNPERLQKLIGTHLRYVREEAGYRIRDIEKFREELGIKINQSYLSRMELGEVSIPIRTLYPLLSHYGVSIGAFFNRCIQDFQSDSGDEQLPDHLRKRIRVLLTRLRQQLTLYTVELQSRESASSQWSTEYGRRAREDYSEMHRHRDILIEVQRLTLATLVEVDLSLHKIQRKRRPKKQNQGKLNSSG